MGPTFLFQTIHNDEHPIRKVKLKKIIKLLSEQKTCAINHLEGGIPKSGRSKPKSVTILVTVISEKTIITLKLPR